MDKNDESSSTIDRCEFAKFAPPLPARLHEHDELGPRSVRTTRRFQATKDAAFQGRKCFRLIPILVKVTIIILLILQILVLNLLVANWTKQGHQNQQNPLMWKTTVLITWSILMTMSCQSFTGTNCWNQRTWIFDHHRSPSETTQKHLSTCSLAWHIFWEICKITLAPNLKWHTSPVSTA